ncbi:MAG: undecaprenyl-diphosphate phosphatase [Myxococcota bacterium]
MSPIEAAWLGLVQGLTEFFPVSSSGHLAMFQALFGEDGGDDLVFEVAVHVATLAAIVVFYRKRILDLILGFLRREAFALDYAGKLVVGSVPAALVGFTAKDWIAEQFGNPLLVAGALVVTGFIVMSTRLTAPGAKASLPDWRQALLIGCAQAFAILPGISRSGSTVAMALALGIAPLAAAEFSFLLGIVAVGGAAILMLPDLAHADAAALAPIGIGFAAALASGLAAIALFVRMLDRQLFHAWAWYCWAVGGAFLLWQLV